MAGYTGGYHWPWSKRNKGHIQVSGKGLSAYGLTVVAFSDPSFKEMMSDFYADDPPELVKIAEPTCVFLGNGSNKTLVAYDLTYDFQGPNGTVSSNDYGPKLLPALMDLPASRLAEDPWVSIPPGSTRLVSPLFSFVGLTKGQRAPTFADENDRRRVEEFVKSGVKYTFDWSSTATVSLDGVFFEDGSFVGPDASRFFEQTKATVDARRDAVEWFVGAVRKQEQRGESTDLVFAELEEMVKKLPRPSSQGTPADFYKMEKLQAFAEILRMREKLGASRVILLKTKMLETKWPVLCKVSLEA
ncbi:MAG TPA: hypothetical protein VJX67_15985 [Blastocatellia bacterium]|nr:hypothetical protein [Blastocatellia bacterium]